MMGHCADRETSVKSGTAAGSGEEPSGAQPIVLSAVRGAGIGTQPKERESQIYLTERGFIFI